MSLLRKIGALCCTMAMAVSSACDGDELKGLSPDSFSIDKNDYKLSKGILFDYGRNEDGTGHDFDIFLASDDISIHLDGENDFLGKGNAVYLDLSSLSDDGLSPGQYTWDSQDDNSFIEGLVYLDFDFDSEASEAIIAEKGIVSVDNDENGYSIKFVMKLDDGKLVKGAYDGLLTKIQG